MSDESRSQSRRRIPAPLGPPLLARLPPGLIPARGAGVPARVKNTEAAMSIIITITIPAPAVLTRRPDLTWRSVRPLVPVLLAGAEQLVPGLGLVVAIAGVLGVRAAVGSPDAPEVAAVPAGEDADDAEERLLLLAA